MTGTEAWRAAHGRRLHSGHWAAADTGVVRAADADGSKGRAVGTDRPAALGAGQPGLAIGMPVAVLGLGRRHPG